MQEESTKNIPPWAHRIDEYGKRRWRREKPWNKRRGEYIGNLIFNLIFLWIVNKIPDWNPGFIRENYNVVLWILNVNILIQIGGNALMLLIDHPVIRYLSRIIMEAAGFLTLIVLFYIFPFDFSKFHGLFWLDWFIPIVLIIGMVISALKVFTNLWKLIFWR
ncbi:MAG: hypothetical protein M0Q38_04885 [Bacteroidales bacterium]|jgi:hypothetical protein|nr:hypothetical protein [Bacteroidales bacterium]